MQLEYKDVNALKPQTTKNEKDPPNLDNQSSEKYLKKQNNCC
jgi:hypothetical protein